MWRRSLLPLLLLLLIVVSTVWAQTSGITSPSPGQTLRGLVTISGTAVDPNFLRYELAFLREDNPAAGWIPFADGDQQVINGTLAVWDTTVGQNVNAPVFPDGGYQLRLRVVRTDFNYDEYFVNGLRISNNSVLPQPSPVPTDPPLPTATQFVPQPQSETPELSPTAPPTPTPLRTRTAPTLIPTVELQATLEQPDVLPTLTPFPTPTPQATAERQGFVLNGGDDGGDDGSVLESVFGFNYGVWGSAFTRGFTLTFALFAVLALYLLLRNTLRLLWRLFWSLW